MGDSRFTVEDLLINWGLDLGAFTNDFSYNTKVVLSNEEKERVTKILTDIGLAMQDQNKEFERIFNIGPYDEKVDFSEFKYGIENELGDDIAMIAIDLKSISLLRNYLLYDAEYDERVKVKFLYSCLFPTGDDKPEIKSKMNCITDFIDFLQKTPDFDFQTELKNASHEEFDKIMDAYNYNATNENMKKLKDAFTNPKTPEEISINLIKRNINLLAPEFLNSNVKVDKKEINDRLTHVDPRIKNLLQKISTYLK